MKLGPEDLSEPIGRALDKLADEDAAEVLAAARSGAKAHVQQLLEGALIERLLARAFAAQSLAQLSTASEHRLDEERGRQPDTGGEEALYLYGVVFADEPPPTAITGVPPGGPVETVTCDGLAAVVSCVPLSEFGDEHLKENLEKMPWLERTARAHEAVIEVVRTRCTMIPMRLCTLFRSRQAICDMLSREAEPLQEALARLAGRSEWGVKVLADLPRIQLSLSSASATHGERDDVSTGRGYLEVRRAERRLAREVETWVRETVHEVHQSLAAAAAIGLRNPVQPRELSGYAEEMVLNGVYLVADSELEEFRNCVDHLNERHSTIGLRLELTGPWPPYNFVAAPEDR
jgi:hypothetical protein